MTITRRELLELSSTLLGGTLLCTACSPNTNTSSGERKKLGLIFPPTGRGVPEEGLSMYGSDIEFLIETLGLETMTPEGYEAVIPRIAPAAERLVARGAEAVILMGTSLSFFKGEEFNQRLLETVQEATGLPSITMATAVIDGLKEVNSNRVVAATAYNDDVNDRLNFFLNEHGFDVLTIQGLGIEAVGDIFGVTQPQLIDFSEEVANSVNDADSILVSCGGLITLDILAPLEARVGIPAVSSTPHTLYAGAKLLGMNPKVPGYGTLISS